MRIKKQTSFSWYEVLLGNFTQEELNGAIQLEIETLGTFSLLLHITYYLLLQTPLLPPPPPQLHLPSPLDLVITVTSTGLNPLATEWLILICAKHIQTR